ncbi:MAG: hypothetical protein HY000_06265 [Planctomycetes bacterium]|nr:hypothetical protein [Planctomycetota bacterium]
MSIALRDWHKSDKSTVFSANGHVLVAMEPSWKQADAFPVIARLIEAAYQEQPRFIKADEIAERLLLDSEGRAIVEAAHVEQQDQSLEWLASNMVSWFSQRITVGESDWAHAFERKKEEGLWAYKPVPPVG